MAPRPDTMGYSDSDETAYYTQTNFLGVVLCMMMGQDLHMLFINTITQYESGCVGDAGYICPSWSLRVGCFI